MCAMWENMLNILYAVMVVVFFSIMAVAIYVIVQFAIIERKMIMMRRKSLNAAADEKMPNCKHDSLTYTDIYGFEAWRCNQCGKLTV